MSGKHLYGQMWINVHLFFKPEIKPDLLPNRFYSFFSIRLEKKRGGEGLGKRNKGRKQSECVSYLWGSCQKKPDSESGRNKDKKKNCRIGRKGRQRESSDAPQSCCGLLK